MDQWLHACEFDIRECGVPNEVIQNVDGVMEAIVSAEGEKAETATQRDDD